MSGIRICDRCGANIGAPKDSNPGLYSKTTRGHIVFWQIRNYKERDFDLCESCYEEFLKWMGKDASDDK